MNILVEIFIISFACMGLFIVSSDGMLLEPAKVWLDNILPVKGLLRAFYNPIIGCPICYASVWGTTLHFTFSGINSNSLIYWLPVVLSVAFVNKILLSIKENLEK